MTSQPEIQPSPYPTPSKTQHGTVNDVLTTVTCRQFTDKILLTVSQAGMLTHWVHVPLATASADLLSSSGLRTGSENSLLPMQHLTATTVLGATKRAEEIFGQTLAATVASAILMKRPREERMLVVALGAPDVEEMMGETEEFGEVMGLVLGVL